MQIFTGYVLIYVGLIFEVLAVVVWLGFMKPRHAKPAAAGGIWDVLVALIEKSWQAAVGLTLIYFGLRMVGISLT
ncbi:MAG: hypothetical protein HY355_02910 [Armatimonadetes bacterium]|nr:hypothetical protein [Armatimonadota bacterium]